MPLALSVTLAALALQSDPTSAGASERDGNAAIAAPLTAEQIAEGWISLFDGETLLGWQPTSAADWRVENGEVRVSAGEEGWLMTTSDFADYELHVEFKAPAATNSGVFLRTPLEPKDPAKDCLEINIAPRDNPFPTTSIVGRLNTPIESGGQRRENGGYRRVDGAQMPNPWDGQWHALEITLNGEACTVAIDGVGLAEYFSEEGNYGLLAGDLVTRGRIGLQFREGEVAFRNIRLKPLGLKPMLQEVSIGENPSNHENKGILGWKTDEIRDATFHLSASGEWRLLGDYNESSIHEISETLLSVTGGPGELETQSSYGDFVMQLDCFVDGDGLNSGVFFRSIPGEFANGYESQISNAIHDGDPARPVDAGTGAIYRRTTARRVVSKDHEWFSKTIIAAGPHIAVWVNGYQVTDWTDDRKPDPNPRKGLRLDPGTISLQAHDPKTNLRFRRLRIVELPDRGDSK